MELIHTPWPLGVFEQRPDWTDYFLDIAGTVSNRSTCPRLQVGCVITQGNRIIATGYNGAPGNQPHCYDEGCFLIADHCTRAIHAEPNALMFLGSHTKFLSAYITHRPCEYCEALLKANNIKKVFYRNEYPL